MTVASEWAETSSRLAAEPWPSSVLGSARAALLDFIGVATGGAGSDVVAAMAAAHGYSSDRAPVAPGNGSAPSIGWGRWSDPATAATINAAAGHVLDLDDGHRLAAGHPGVVTIPAALASAEAAGGTGARLTSAIILGYQAFVTLGRAINPEHLDRGFHTTATVGATAAGVAAAVAAGLDVAGIARAISLAALLGAGLMEVTTSGGEVKPLQVGRAAGVGVLAARLAASGVAGPDRALEGKSGFIRATSGLSLEPSDLPLERHGWAIDGRYVKRHSACRHTHAAIDAALILRERGAAADPAAVESITISTYASASSICGGPARPGSVADARFSLPFTVALALVEGDVGPLAVTERALADPAVGRYSDLMKVDVDPELERLHPDRRGARVEVVNRDGRVEVETVLVAKGEPEDSLSREELEAKFDLTVQAGGLPPSIGRQLLELVDGVAALHSAADLLRPLAEWRPSQQLNQKLEAKPK